VPSVLISGASRGIGRAIAVDGPIEALALDELCRQFEVNLGGQVAIITPAPVMDLSLARLTGTPRRVG
jgi:hypothetical protein